jgi:hypothetical protein
MNLLKLFPLLLLMSCSEKYYCTEYAPRMETRHMYEFTYEGNSRNFITDDDGVVEEGIANGVYAIYGVNRCCTIVAKYPIKSTTYRLIKDTVVQTGSDCVEWKTRGR